MKYANCSAEKAFSKVKNKYTTSQIQENVYVQMILYSEKDLLKSIDLNEVLKELTSNKERKKIYLVKEFLYILYLNFFFFNYFFVNKYTVNKFKTCY